MAGSFVPPDFCRVPDSTFPGWVQALPTGWMCSNPPYDAVKSRVEAGREMNLHYDHPILLLQHMIWHEGYHHGQIKLALKLAGHPITDEQAGPITWGVWMGKTDRSR
jgi:hypothetical protein